MLLPSIQMCNQLFNSLINQTSAWDKDGTERTDSDISKPIISLILVVFDVTCSCYWLHMLVWLVLFAVSHDVLNPEVFIFFSSSFNLVWRLFVSICLHSAILTLCLLTFAFWLSAHLSSMLSSYLSSSPIYFLYLYHPITRLHIHTRLP